MPTTAPQDATQEAPNIRGLMLLWLVITTRVGPHDAPYFQTLSATTQAGKDARSYLAGKFQLPLATVEYFVRQANDAANASRIDTIQVMFHDWVRDSSHWGPYAGDICPLSIDAITALMQ